MNLAIHIVIGITVLSAFSQIKTKQIFQKTPKPSYQTIQRFDHLEIRNYPKMIKAYPELDSWNYGDNSNKGFILGVKNKSSITTPIIARIGTPMKMNFTLPSADNLGQLAHPNNKSSKLQTEATINNALNSFRRFTNDTDSKHYTIKLKSLPKFAGINNSGEAHFYSYNTTDQLLKKMKLLSHY